MLSLAREFAPKGVAREYLTQQKVNFVDSRLRSAEHSSELDALHLLARELRLFDARCASVDAPRARLRDVDRDCWYDRRGQRRTTL